ncbi:COQ9 family protein [Jannaschia sp. S6380]|uniref:COQ9 family protein n=1 Tax=Jannaschia sp. S6380 TaxID=2926408 RepID=UPI001FF3D973|nr:COQ9 family protein [Jannaschia sp. S6380]MCK0167737.1 COQ9 family protein [Jannaschia sp. S6380]
MTPLKDRMIDAALPHVAFDGWSEATFRRAVEDAKVTPAQGRAAFPRGAIDLALAFHRRGDDRMVDRLAGEDLSQMRFRDRVAHAVRTRLEIAGENREAVRRATTLFALPIHAADGTRALWGTADAIWEALGDTSQDVNWYTKRATLSGVYSATLLYWLGDQSEGRAETWGFLDRRIEDVMRIEKLKAHVRENPVLSRLMAGPNMILERVRAPARPPRGEMPGFWRDPT